MQGHRMQKNIFLTPIFLKGRHLQGLNLCHIISMKIWSFRSRIRLNIFVKGIACNCHMKMWVKQTMANYLTSYKKTRKIKNVNFYAFMILVMFHKKNLWSIWNKRLHWCFRSSYSEKPPLEILLHFKEKVCRKICF